GPGRSATRAGISVPDVRFEALIFDWDGTAVPDRSADAGPVRERIEALCAAGMDVYVVSGTHVDNVDGQLGGRPNGPGRLFLCLNRGSEVFAVGPDGPHVVYRRTATREEDEALDRAAASTVARLARSGLRAEVVSQRLNRRKIDLIPDPAWSDPPKAIIDRLLEAVTDRLRAHGFGDVEEIVEIAREAAHASGVSDPRITSDVKHVEIGLTDKSDSLRWALDDLYHLGVGPGLVLIAGDEFGPIGGVPGSDSMMLVAGSERATAISVGIEPDGVPGRVLHLGGGPATFLDVVDDQIDRRRARRVPAVDPDPAWCVVVDGDPRLARVRESILTLSESPFGLRGSVEEDGAGTHGLLAASDLFDRKDAETTLAEGPLWTELSVAPNKAATEHRTLDMRNGILLRERSSRAGRFRTMRFLSSARAGLMAMRAEGPPRILTAGADLTPPEKASGYTTRTKDGTARAEVRTALGGRMLAAVRTEEGFRDGLRMIERVAAYGSYPSGPPDADRLDSAIDWFDFDGSLAYQRATWAARWRDAGVSIEGDPAAELAARFAIFHLLGVAAGFGESAVGARGVSGCAYGGHVFWDADVFVLPALAAIKPSGARSMLEYRLRRIEAARRAALREGRAGARFPWESADSGDDVTPRLVHADDGRAIPIRTGQHELHIVADVAWAAWHYATWTGDTAFLDGSGRDLVTDTARYWASKARRDRDGRAHIYGVTGPDEYHEIVDDNAFTNIMARWNLRRAAELVRADGRGGTPEEAEQWSALADALVDGYDSSTGIYEQFAGFHGLEPLVISEISRVPVAADVLLGSKRVLGAQVIKQPDVLMLHHMIPDDVVAGSLAPNLAHYGPRTAHGSSLSPAIQAALLARSGRPDEALVPFRLACRMDLDDLTGTTASGLHIATMGGVWQALAFGFLGLAAEGEALRVAPVLPATWDALEMTFRFRGRRLRVRAENGSVTIDPDAPLVVRPGARPLTKVPVGGATFVLDGDEDAWEGETP
ncbi:MAG: glycosyl hydrolase family 65 protein, partial [Actinomycetota bacterium]